MDVKNSQAAPGPSIPSMRQERTAIIAKVEDGRADWRDQYSELEQIATLALLAMSTSSTDDGVTSSPLPLPSPSSSSETTKSEQGTGGMAGVNTQRRHLRKKKPSMEDMIMSVLARAPDGLFVGEIYTRVRQDFPKRLENMGRRTPQRKSQHDKTKCINEHIRTWLSRSKGKKTKQIEGEGGNSSQGQRWVLLDSVEEVVVPEVLNTY
ncbi:MAG: hypothetical protein M1818_000326 [Claussenomyces sp. TS43310]|nr:MAG: hypothetical protein M1818_000326 [Claussenomyces sp. TS43310]